MHPTPRRELWNLKTLIRLCEQRGCPLEGSFLLFAMASRIISLLQRCTKLLISRLLRTQDTMAFQFSHLTLEATKDLYFQTDIDHNGASYK